MAHDPLAIPGDDSLPINGPLRVEPSVRALVRRLKPGDVAVIDVLDLDQRSANAIAERRPAAVVNVQQSISGRYPNGGPLVLSEAGIPIVDNVGGEILAVRDGAKVRIDGGDVLKGDATVAQGTRLTDRDIVEAMQAATAGMEVQLAAFTANAMDHVQRDAALLLEGKGLPDVGVNLEGKQVVIVAPGHGLREQLKSIRPFVRERKPVIIAVGDAADDARDVLRAPVIIVGGVEVCSEDVLKRASHVVVHDASGTDAGLTRVEALDVPHSVFESGIASEEVAILLAHARGASVIVTAGIDTRLLDFLEQGRAEVAGTFLTRLQAGASVVDATVLAAVYRHRFSGWLLVVMMLAGIAAVGAALYATPGGRSWLEDVWTTVGGWVGLA